MRTYLIALTALLLSACSPATEQPAETPVDAGAEAVEIVDFAFSPDELEVPVGTTVEWVQLDSSRHTVDFDRGDESGTLEEGDTYQRTFDEPGEYSYICFFHPRMAATVTVTG